MSNEIKTKGTPTIGLIGATLGFFIGFAAVVALGATAKFFSTIFTDLGIPVFFIGLLVAVPNLSGSLLRIPFAAWSDSVGGRKPFLALLLLSIVGFIGIVLLVFTTYPNLGIIHYPILLILGFLAGCGIATFSVGISQTSYWYPQKEQGKALGVYAGLGNTAPGIFSLVLAISLSVFTDSATDGLGESYTIWAILLISGTLIYYFYGLNAWSFQLEEQGLPSDEAMKTAGEAGQELFPKYSLVQSLKSSGSVWQTWVLVGLYFTSFGGFIALASWLPSYWNAYFEVGTIDFIGLSLGIALLLNAVFVILGSLVRVYSGQLADKITGELTVAGGLIVLFTGALIMIFSSQTSFILALLGMLLLSTGMGAVNAGVFKLVPKAVPDAVGGAAGWIGGLGAFGGFIIPPIMGGFVDTFSTAGYAYGYVTFIILAIISLAIVWIITKKNK